jgi:hypothetical protein
MPEPALQKSLVQLATIVKQLEKESDSLNTTIAEFEASLAAVNPGITIWSPTLLRHDEVKLTGAQLGFTKHDDEWGQPGRKNRRRRTVSGLGGRTRCRSTGSP